MVCLWWLKCFCFSTFSYTGRQPGAKLLLPARFLAQILRRNNVIFWNKFQIFVVGLASDNLKKSFCRNGLITKTHFQMTKFILFFGKLSFRKNVLINTKI